jgi:hypothetical protein
LILNDDMMKSSGQALSQAEAISQAHEAIGEGLRANAGPDDDAITFFMALVAFLRLKLLRHCGHF